MIALYNEFNSQGLEIISISLDSDKSEWLKAIEEDGILGLFTGGFTACAAGVSSALIFSYLASLFFRPKMKK